MTERSFNEGYLEGLKTAREVVKGFDRSIVSGGIQEMIIRRLTILIRAISGQEGTP